MREQVDFLDTATMSWSNPRPGIYTKILSRDPLTTARTALSRVVPADGYIDQPTAHCHESTEEILVTSGMISFDSRVWLHPGGYVYHPAFYVHGFKSTVPQASSFLSRVSADPKFRYFDEPTADYPYFIGSEQPTRQLSIVASPWASLWMNVQSAGSGPISEFVYSADNTTGDRSVLRRYTAGAEDDGLSADPAQISESFVLEGILTDSDGRTLTKGCFRSILPGRVPPPLRALTNALVYHSIFR